MSDYERRGFLNFVYLTLASHTEGLIAAYLKALVMLAEPLAMKRNNVFPTRTAKIEGNSRELTMEPEFRMVERLLRSVLEQLESSPYAQLNKLHSIVAGKTLSEFIGLEAHHELDGLFALRNLLAHGRDHYIVEDIPLVIDETTNIATHDYTKAVANFDGHALEKTVSRLRKIGVFPAKQRARIQPSLLIELFYKDAAVLHFYSVVAGVDALYRRKAEETGTILFWFSPVLPTLTEN